MSDSNASQSLTGLILAAGKGTRMKSDLPKCLHQVCGVPMVKLAADNLTAAGVQQIVIVVGHGGEQIIKELGDQYRYAWQHEQLGTGHAVQCALNELGEIDGTWVIACGDTPLISTEYFSEFIDAHRASQKVCSVSVAKLADATGYGRVQIESGEAKRIVEQKDATEEERQIPFANAGMYCVDGASLKEALSTLKNDNASGEYYLTDIVSYFNSQGLGCNAFVSEDANILMGVNDRKQLAKANQILQASINEHWMEQGVTFVDPAQTYVGPSVSIGKDTILLPGTFLVGETKIGEKCQIGPYTRLTDVTVGDHTIIFFTQAERAHIGSEIKMGPFANIRPKSTLSDGVRIGNFVEINRSHLEEGVKVNHLTYIGDSTIGTETNIGAGTITCNYDGFNKHQTKIGKNAFVGSNSTLVAPVEIGDGSVVAAGSVITEDVPADALALGRARQTNKENYAAIRRQQQNKK